MSLITYGLAHSTLLTMGLGTGVRITMTKVRHEVEAPKEVEFVNLPAEVEFEKEEVEE